MARRDHSLDSRITAAAFEEFSEKGYAGASLRKIAEKADATVGAIQIRYKSKDELFVSLLKPFLSEIEAAFQSIRSDYYSGADEWIPARLKASIQRESAVILHLIFDHYDEAVLLLYQSAGSSLEGFFDTLVARKIEESSAFFRSTGYAGVDEQLLGLVISVQFDSYRRIIASCRDRETAERYMNALMIYHFGGWTALFDAADHTKQESKNKNEVQRILLLDV